MCVCVCVLCVCVVCVCCVCVCVCVCLLLSSLMPALMHGWFQTLAYGIVAKAYNITLSALYLVHFLFSFSSTGLCSSVLPDSDTNSESSVPDVIKRVTRLRLSDVEQDEANTQTSETRDPSSGVVTMAQDETTPQENQSSGDSTSAVLPSRETTCTVTEEKEFQHIDGVEGVSISKEESTEPHFSPARKVGVHACVCMALYVYVQLNFFLFSLV